MIRAFTLDKGFEGGGGNTSFHFVYCYYSMKLLPATLFYAGFQAQLNVYIISSMHINEEEVHSISDKLLPAVKRQLK